MCKNAFLNTNCMNTTFIDPASVLSVMNYARNEVRAKRKKDLKFMKKNVESNTKIIMELNTLVYSFIKMPSVTYKQAETILNQLEYINAKQENILANYENTSFSVFLKENKDIYEKAIELSKYLKF